MSDLSRELGELRTYVKYLRSDRDRLVKDDAWTKWVTLSIVFLAVAAALASQQYGNFSARVERELNFAALEQGKATNQWGYYQAVSIKLHMYRFEKHRRARETKAAAPVAKAVVAPPKSTRGLSMSAFIESKIKKYTKQKTEIIARARGHEKTRDAHQQSSRRNRRHTSELVLALAVLQVAIAVAAIALLSRKKPLWFVSMAIGAFGIFQTFNGMFLWFS